MFNISSSDIFSILVEVKEIKLVLKYMSILFLKKEMHSLGMLKDDDYKNELADITTKIANL